MSGWLMACGFGMQRVMVGLARELQRHQAQGLTGLSRGGLPDINVGGLRSRPARQILIITVLNMIIYS